MEIEEVKNLDQMAELMNEDLSREYAHWHFYMHAAINVTGLHREELSEFFMKEAAGEMQHIKEFGVAILSLGVKPTTLVAPYHNLDSDPITLLNSALHMEKIVVENYAKRLSQLEKLSECNLVFTDAKYLSLFYEEQLMDSRNAVNEISLMLK